MKIRVHYTFEEEIGRALRLVNGKAEVHVYTEYYEIALIADWAEAELESLGLPKNMRSGAVVWSRSGDRLPNSYKHQRIVTHVRLMRGRIGWYLMDTTAGGAYSEAGRTTLYLTKEQDQCALEEMRKRYVIKEEP